MRARLAAQDGISIVPAILTLSLLILLGGIAVQQAVIALEQTDRNERTKRALQAADAGVEAAVFALNRADLPAALHVDPLDPQATPAQLCVAGTGTVGELDLQELPSTTPSDPDGRRWCPAHGPETGPDGTVWSYRASAPVRVGSGACGGDGGPLSLERVVVGVGQSRGRTRRVRVRLRAALSLFSGAAVQGDDGVGMSGLAKVLGAVASNGNITGEATNVISGNATPGPGRTVSGGVVPLGASTPACHPFVLPEVRPPDGHATANDNVAGMSLGCVDHLNSLQVKSCDSPLLGTTGGATYDPAQRTLKIWGDGIARLTGAVYSFCRIEVTGQGILHAHKDTAVVRIFLDDPAGCEGVTGAGQIVMDGSSRIVNCHASTAPETLQLYALGAADGSNTTQSLRLYPPLDSASNLNVCGLSETVTGTPMVVYAPRSLVDIGNQTAIAGQVVGNRVAVGDQASVQPVNALVNLNGLGANPTIPLYTPVDYSECPGATFAELPPEAPAQGC